MEELYIQLGVAGVFIFAGLVVLVLREKKKSKDLYGFDLENWGLVHDDQRLYEIELLFTQGLVARVLNKTGHSIRDWHSNLKKQNSEQYTGYMKLSEFVSTSVVDTNSGSFDLDHGWSFRDTNDYRYFYARL